MTDEDWKRYRRLNREIADEAPAIWNEALFEALEKLGVSDADIDYLISFDAPIPNYEVAGILGIDIDFERLRAAQQCVVERVFDGLDDDERAVAHDEFAGWFAKLDEFKALVARMNEERERPTTGETMRTMSTGEDRC